MKPLISIIIPVFNTEKYLLNCLNSAMAQSLRDIEMICVDDCSTDGSAQVIQTLQKTDNRIRLVKMAENSGSGPCRNEGIKQARGEFVAFLDSDDLFATSTCLKKLYQGAKDNNVYIAGGNLHVFDDDNAANAKDWGKATFTENRLYNYGDYPNSHGYSRFIYNRKFIIESNLLFPPLRRYQDPVWFASAMIQAKNFYAMDLPVYAYRKSHQTIIYTAEKVDHVIKGMLININIFNKKRLLNHCKNEKKELYNFIYRVIYGGVFQGQEFFAILKIVRHSYKTSDHLHFGLHDVGGLIKMGLIILKNKIKRICR